MDKLDVLIIEDDKDTAVFFSTVLSLVGFNCDIVLTAKEALARLAAEIPDMILLDMRLGLEIGGEDILYQVRANPRFDNTRVIVITAFPRTAEPVTNLADLILLKPVDVEQLQHFAQRIGSLEEKPKRLPFRDPVSELYNTDFYLTRLEHVFERSKRNPNLLFAVTIFILQPTETRDDILDPDILLGILREVAERLRENLRPTDTIARFSGWKFAALFEDLKADQDVFTIQKRMDELLTRPYNINRETYYMKVRFGFAISKPDYLEAKDLLLAAEQSLEQPAETL